MKNNADKSAAIFDKMFKDAKEKIQKINENNRFWVSILHFIILLIFTATFSLQYFDGRVLVFLWGSELVAFLLFLVFRRPLKDASEEEVYKFLEEKITQEIEKISNLIKSGSASDEDSERYLILKGILEEYSEGKIIMNIAL